MKPGGTRRSTADVRAALIDAARRWAALVREIRALTLAMREARCAGVADVPCWAADPERAWKRRGVPIPDSYCGPCRANTERARQRRVLRRRVIYRRSRLLACAVAFEASLWADADPLPKRKPGETRRARMRRARGHTIPAACQPGLFERSEQRG